MFRPFRAGPRLAGAGLLTVALLWCAGCSETGVGTVQGKVTFDGKPLKRGMITFLSDVGNKDSFSSQIKEGEYAAVEIPVGSARVIIIPDLADMKGNEAETVGGGDVIPTAKPGKRNKGPTQPIPDRYQNPATSGLSVTVKKGENPPYDVNITP